MHLLYLDESGSVGDPAQEYFVLAGVSVFERMTHWIEQDLNKIAKQFSPNAPHDIELHGSPMRSGRENWKQFPLPDRLQAIQDALTSINHPSRRKSIRLFGAVIKKSAVSGIDPVEHAFEQISSRFDLFLKRLHQNGDTQRGLILFDKASTEKRIQTLAREFKYQGHSFGQNLNYAEVPVFLDSKASRLIQLADLVAYSLYRHFESQDSRFYNIIENAFDSEGGVKHGLYVKE